MAQARLLSAAARLDAEVARLCELLCPGARPDEIDAALVLPDLAADLLSVARQVRPPGRCDPRSPDFESCDDWEWQSHADWSGEVESFEQARRAANVPGLIARCGRTDPDLVLEPAAPASSPAPAATPSVSPAPAAPPVPPSGLRSIDWASRSYAFAARSYASEQRERREIELRGGRAQQTIQSSSGADTLTTVLFEVKYADLFGDDREEAVVVLSATMPTAAFTWAAGYLLVFAPGPAGEPLLVDTVRAPPPGRVRLVGPGVVEVSARPGVDLSPHPCVERLRATDAGWQPVLRRCGR